MKTLSDYTPEEIRLAMLDAIFGLMHKIAESHATLGHNPQLDMILAGTIAGFGQMSKSPLADTGAEPDVELINLLLTECQGFLAHVHDEIEKGRDK